MRDSGIIVLNVPAVAGALAQYPQIARAEFHAATEAALLLNVAALAAYPSATGGSYRRTGTLGRTWTQAQPEWQALASGFQGTLGNATPYGPYVQDDARQARRMAGRWRNTPKRVVAGNKGRIEALYRAALQRIEAKITKVTT